MKVIKHRQVMEDQWQLIAGDGHDQRLPATDIIVPFAWWREQPAVLEEHPGKVAVYLNPDDEVALLAPLLADFPMIALNFPQFKDGRVYSQARMLRERYHYKGELRAVGEVLRDQLFYMQRCGFDAFQISADKDSRGAISGLDDFSLAYQAAADDSLPVYRAGRLL